MYEDLDVENWPEDQRPDEHPVLPKLLVEGFEPPETTIWDGENLDAHLAPEDTYLVVDVMLNEEVLVRANGHLTVSE